MLKMHKQRLNPEVVEKRIKIIKLMDKTKLRWVKKLSEILNMSHGPLRRFIKKYCPEELIGVFSKGD